MLALEPVIRARLDFFLLASVAGDPHRVGDPLLGRLAGDWRYRVGEYRLMCRIEEARRAVVVTKVGPRSTFYFD
jgi:mRNA interferase RelE/StbE